VYVNLLFTPQFSHILSVGLLREIKMTDQIMTLKEVAEYLKLTDKTAYKLAAEKNFQALKSVAAGGLKCLI
jgi:excisionase family DNA binding protein